MATSIEKTIVFNRYRDVDDFLPRRQAINDYEDGKVIADVFSRHNTLEEYMKLLETFKK